MHLITQNLEVKIYIV